MPDVGTKFYHGTVRTRGGSVSNHTAKSEILKIMKM
jgi:hypothetical protein